ncbi:hypothetical protein FPQ18DRAFT_416481 [Pyronema domesticum]|nr:hypothetical protein FPQ18DRAFT_416481 [Pyronema domesticum]
MVVTHKYLYAENSSTPGVSRIWNNDTLSTVPLYSTDNLPPPPQRIGSAGGKLLIKITHVCNTVLAVGRVIECFDDGFNLGDIVIGPFGWRDYVLAHATDVEGIPENEKADIPRYLALKGSGVIAYHAICKAGQGGTMLIDGASCGIAIIAEQVAALMNWKVWGRSKKDGVMVASATGGCKRVWTETSDIEDMEMVNSVLACNGVDKDLAEIMKRGTRLVFCGECETTPETRGMMDERDIKQEKVCFSDLTKEDKTKAFEALMKWGDEGKIHVVVDLQNAHFEAIPVIMKAGGVGEIVVELRED